MRRAVGQLVKKKPVRSISGIVVVAVMAHPFPCPHGKCIYCPGGVNYGTPQSYVKDSPAVLRARHCLFDPYLQTTNRLYQYVKMGHQPSKVEVIVMGGTFPAMPLKYQEWFIANIFEALNRFPKTMPRDKYVSLKRAQKVNEKAKIRCVGLTIETRPDWSMEKHVDLFLHLGATRIELGVQTLDNEILRKLDVGIPWKTSLKRHRF